MINGMKLLVANRGEIAVRILHTCRELGIPSVAVYTDVDHQALHVQYADEAIPLGEPHAYLDFGSILSAAKKTGATAIHPGYGFLSENGAFARVVEEAGLIFVGPRPETISLMGDKLVSRQSAMDAGLPVLPGSDKPLPPILPPGLADQITFPVLVKAAAGGGGRGIRLACSVDELPQMVEAARQEALSAFGDDTVFIESMVQQARHIEVQILGDGFGNILCIGDRECSIQRRRQKLIEEAPVPGLSGSIRTQLYDAAFRLGSSLRYRGLGTVEFLLDSSSNFHFIEVNPRIQVEHPVTEMVTGMDLVKEQLMIAQGARLSSRIERVESRGTAIEARVLAENPECDFLPTTGQISFLKEPGGPGIRVDSALYQGMEIGTEYDSLLAKVIAWGADRHSAIQRLVCALDVFQIAGLATDLEFLKQVLNSPRFMAGDVTTTYLEEFKPPQPVEDSDLERVVALAAAVFTRDSKKLDHSSQTNQPNRWQQAAWFEQMRGCA